MQSNSNIASGSEHTNIAGTPQNSHFRSWTGKKDFLTGTEWSTAETKEMIRVAATIKADPARYRTRLKGRRFALIFEKPSLRTRIGFEIGIQMMGGTSIFLDCNQSSRLGQREAVVDVARVLERWVHCIIARVYDHRVLEELAINSRIPVINALSDRFHPCQAMADYFTLDEKFGQLRGFQLAYVGDGNNVCNSLMLAGARLSVHVRIATPPDYAPAGDIVHDAREICRQTGGKIDLLSDPREVVSGAHGIYTDVWTSMGFEAESAAREKAFSTYRITSELMALAAPNAVFMHCLPAHRGQEVTGMVLESPSSIVIDQAENRLYSQAAILAALFG